MRDFLKKRLHLLLKFILSLQCTCLKFGLVRFQKYEIFFFTSFKTKLSFSVLCSGRQTAERGREDVIQSCGRGARLRAFRRFSGGSPNSRAGGDNLEEEIPAFK